MPPYQKQPRSCFQSLVRLGVLSLRWLFIACACCFMGGITQGLWAGELGGNRAARQWVREENRKCPKMIRQWLDVADKEGLYEKERPVSATVMAEKVLDGSKYFGREQLPSPPDGYQVEHLSLICLGGNNCCLATYMKPGKYPERVAALYLWQGHQWSKLLQNEGTMDDLEGIEFLRISPGYDPLVVVTNFGGGSGIGRILYSVSGKGQVRRLLNIGNWNEGGYNLHDFDGDGVLELVHRTRVWHPTSLKARLSKGEDYDLVDPILYKDTIYRWRKDHFEVAGYRYWIDG